MYAYPQVMAPNRAGQSWPSPRQIRLIVRVAYRDGVRYSP